MSEYFTNQTFTFLRQLKSHNNHEWFRGHKDDYERFVREPALRLIDDVRPDLLDISTHFIASSKKVGGSLFRVMKDTRFEHESGPYKPWIGIRFYHERSKNVHAPGYYIHIEKGNSFLGGGIWKPDPKVLRKIRDFLVDNPKSWQQASTNKALKAYSLDGEQLVKLPRGFESNPMIDEALRHKSLIWSKPIDDELIISSKLRQSIVKSFKDLSAPIDYLCAALDLEF